MLKNAQELFDRRKSLSEVLETARRGAEWGIVGDLHLRFTVREQDRTGRKFDAPKGLHLAKEDGAALCKLAVAVLAERLKDIDAALKAFGCEPPKSAPL
jgi:hypothetical protein